jgi:phage protein D
VPDNQLLSQFFIKIGGQDAPEELMDSLVEVTVEDSIHLPDMFAIRLHDPRLRWVDSDTLAEGKLIEISASARQGTRVEKLITGEITAVEPDFGADGIPALTVQGYDRSHRLHRGRHTRSFVQMTDSDIAQKIAQEEGLTAEVDSTRQVHDYVFQNNESNMAFLYARAVRIGYELYVQDKTLHFSEPGDDEGPTLEWGANLRSFRPRLTTARQESEVVVRGWDPKAKREIVGRATEGQGAPEIGESRAGSQVASDAFQKDGKVLVVNRPVGDQTEAEGLARALFDELASSFVKASGVASGDPRLRAGKVVSVEAVGDRFSGRYHLTATTHRYRAQDYVTMFHVTGKRPRTLSQLLEGQVSDEVGVVVGIVTNNDDPEGMGRVRVKYPWLADDEESAWARVVSFMAGKDRGAFFLPEVNDEVLLAFDHGNVHRPYVLGVLWNGKDKPPESNSVVLDGSGQVVQRIIKSRAGHTILLDDTSGGGGITIVDRADNKIAIDSGSNAMSIEVKGNLEIKANGKVTIKGDAGVEISSSANVDVKGAVVKLN